MNNDIPKLLHGRNGVPLELEIYLRRQAENKTGIACKPSEFAGAGVEQVAWRLLEELKLHQNDSLRRAGEKSSRADLPRLPSHIANWVYLLHCYCHKFTKPAPPALLQLTFSALGCQEQKVSSEIAGELGLPVGVADIEKFSDAAALDGEADANGKSLSVAYLAKVCGMSRDTIRRWREYPQYQKRRTATASIYRSSGD